MHVGVYGHVRQYHNAKDEINKAVCPVHLYGQPANMTAISEIARKHDILVIEDNAQGIGSAGDTFKIGAVITNRADVTGKIKQLRNDGSPTRSIHSMGYNSRLDDLHAAVLSVKLKYIDQWNDRRRKLHLPPDVPRADRGGAAARGGEGHRVGEGKRVRPNVPVST